MIITEGFMQHPVRRSVVYEQIETSRERLQWAREYARQWKQVQKTYSKERRIRFESRMFLDCI